MNTNEEIEQLRYQNALLLSALEVQAQEEWNPHGVNHKGQHEGDCRLCIRIRAAREVLAKVNGKVEVCEHGVPLHIPCFDCDDHHDKQYTPAAPTSQPESAAKPLCPKCGDANVGEWVFNFGQSCGWKCYACHHVWPSQPVAKSKTPETDAAEFTAYDSVGLGESWPKYKAVLSDFARTFERQRDEALEQLAQGNALLRVLRDQVAEGNKSARELSEQLSAVTKDRAAWQSAEFKAMRRFLESRLESNQLRERVEKLKAERDGWETVSAQLRAQLTHNLGQHAAEQIDKVGNHGEEVARELSEMLDAAKDEIAVLRKLATEMGSAVDRSETCGNPDCIVCKSRAELAARFDALRKEW